MCSELVNFMATYGRGLICLSLTEEKADALDLMPMVQDNQSLDLYFRDIASSDEAREIFHIPQRP